MTDFSADKFQALEARCRAEGVPLTTQRRAVLEEVLRREDHPTADDIYEAVTRRHPQVSRRTVYRVLERLVDWGIVRRVHHPGAAARFDGKTRQHHHLVCDGCHEMVDFDDVDLPSIKLSKKAAAGFAVHDFSVHFTGLCPKCQQPKAKKRS